MTHPQDKAWRPGGTLPLLQPPRSACVSEHTRSLASGLVGLLSVWNACPRPSGPTLHGALIFKRLHQLFPTPYAPTWIRKLTVRPSSAAHTVGTACLPEPGLAVCSSRVGACPVSSSRAGARPSRSCSRCRSSSPDRVPILEPRPQAGAAQRPELHS